MEESPQDIMTPQDSLEQAPQMVTHETPEGVSTQVTPDTSYITPAPAADPNALESAPAAMTTEDPSVASNPDQPPAELQQETEDPQEPHEGLFKNRLLRKVFFASAGLVALILLLVGVTAVIQKLGKPTAKPGDSAAIAQIGDQDVQINQQLPTQTNTVVLRDGVPTVVISGDLVVQGLFQIAGGQGTLTVDTSKVTGSQTLSVPNASGEICLSSNNCNFAVEGADAAALAGGGLLVQNNLLVNDGVLSLNGEKGAVNLQGTADQITITSSNGTLTFSLPQDIGITSSPQFTSINLSTAGTQAGFEICDKSNNCNFADVSNAVIQGGNTFGAIMSIGTQDTFGLEIITNNTSRMSISDQGLITLGGSNNDRLAVTAQITGNTAFVFQGASEDVFTTSLLVTDPTATRNIILPNADGTICLSSGNCSGSGGYGDVLNGGNNFNALMTLGTNDNYGFNLKTVNINRLTISNTGDIALLGNTAINADASFGQDSSSRLTFLGQLTGSSPLVFQGSTDDGFATELVVTDPTSNRTIVIPNADGTICLSSGNCAGTGGNGDVLQGGNNFSATMVLGTNDNFAFNLKTNNINRLSITNTGNATFSGDLSVQGSVVLGDATTDRVTVNGQILGGTPFVFQGATDNVYATYFTVQDPTANRSIILPNADGTICLSGGNCAGGGGYGDVLQGGNNFNATMVLGTNDNFGFNFKTNNTSRMTISNTGTITALGDFQVNGNTVLGDSGADTVILQASNMNIPNNLNIDSYTQYIDSANDQVGFGTLPLGVARVSVLALNGGDGLTVNLGSSAGNILNLQDNGVNVVTVGDNGVSTFRNSTNTTASFAIQNTAGASLFNVDTTNNQMSLLGNNSGETGVWQTNANGLTSGRYAATSVIANGYMYIIGGQIASSNASATVQSAKILADGSVGTWNNITSLPTPIYQAASVVANGYVYVMGGSTTGGTGVSTVYYAKLNPDGSVGNWATTTSLAFIRREASAVTANGYVYIMGGSDSGGTVMSSIQYAKLNPDGSLGVWQTAGNTLPAVRRQGTAVTANGYIYYMGGTASSSPVANVYYARINLSGSDGSIGPWASTSSLATNARLATSVVSNGYVYVMGGETGGAVFTAAVQYAKFNSTNGTIGAWQTAANSMPATRERATSVMANGYIYTLGGNTSATSTVYYARTSTVTVGGNLDLVGLQGGNLAEGGDPSAGSAGGSLTAGNGTFVGGLQVQGQTSLANSLNVSGPINGGSSMNLSGGATIATGAESMVVSTPDAYSISGVGGYASTPDSTAISVTGDIDIRVKANMQWGTRGGALLSKGAGSYEFFVSNGGQLRFINTPTGGGTASDVSSSSTVVSAGYASGSTLWVRVTYRTSDNRVQFFTSPDGATWTQLGSNATATATGINDTSSSLFIGARYLVGNYAVNGAIHNAQVYNGIAGTLVASFAASDASNTTSTSWVSRSTAESWLLNGTAKLRGAGSSIGGDLLASGNTTLQANANSTDALKVQNASNQSLLQVDTLNNQVTLLGNNSGEVSAWATASNALPATRSATTNAVTANGYMYMVGGSNSALVAQTTVYYAKINTDGSPGTWSTASNALPAARARHSTIISNGYMYVIAGTDTADVAQTTVYYAKINTDGSPGTWSTASNALPAARHGQQAVVSNGYVYILGGFDGSSYTTTVYYARLNADGSTGTWSTNANALPAARGNAASVVANGYVYVMGGTSGSAQSTVYYARLNADGSTGTWSTNANALPSILRYPLSVVSNGYVYIYGGANSNTLDSTTARLTVYYARLNADGSTGTWITAGNALPAARFSAATMINNGYIYTIAGSDGTNAQATVYYARTSTVTVGGNLDLVGLQGQNLTDSGSPGSGSTGGSLTAGNGTFIGSLQVQGQTTLAQSLVVGGNVNASGSALFKNTSNSTAAFAVQDAAGTNLLNVNTTSQTVSVATAYSSLSMNLSGVSGDYARTPDSAQATITGDIDVQARVALTDWTPSATQAIMAQMGGPSNTKAWALSVLSTGRLALDGFTSSSFTTSSSASPTVSDGQPLWVRATRNATTGTVTFYTAADQAGIPGSWTQLGSTQSTSAGSLQDVSTVITVGQRQSGGDVLQGVMYRARALNGIAGTVVIDFNPSNAASPSSTSWTSITTGEVWTLQGAATLSGTVQSLATFGSSGSSLAGNLSIANRLNSTSLFQVQDASGANLLVVDSTNNRVVVGATGTNPALLVIGTKSTSGDPTGTNGGMYYNASSNKFRCYQNSAWADCIATGSGTGNINQGGNTFGAAITLGTQDNYALNFMTNNTSKLSLTTSGGLIFNQTSSIIANSKVSGTGYGLYFSAGTAPVGGDLSFQGGAATFGGTDGGNLSFTGGDAYSGLGGSLTFVGGGSTTGTPGNLYMYGGANYNTNTYGSIYLGASQNDAIYLRAGTGNVVVGIADTTGVLTVLDTKTDNGDPIGVNGGMYYNSSIGKFRCYEAGAWKNCISSGGSGTGDVNNGGNNYGSSMSLGTLDNYSLSFLTNNVTTFSLSNSGAATFKNASNSTSGFQVQNSSGASLLNIDTSSNQITLLGNNSGEVKPWSTATNVLPANRYGTNNAVTANGYMYVVGGGATSLNGQTTVYYAKINTDGSPGTWLTAANALPAGRADNSTVAVNGYIYVIGGASSGVEQSTVFYAKLNTDGTVGTWNTTTALPGARRNPSSAVANGYVYVIGGADSSVGYSTVFYAKLNADGTVGTWNTNVNALPINRRGASSVVANGYVYVIGNGSSASAPTATVYYAKLNGDGSTAAWSTAANALPDARWASASMVSNGYVYVIGGSNDVVGTPTATVYYARLNADGSVGTWSTAANALPDARYRAASLAANGYMYVMGGYDNTNSYNTVYYTRTSTLTVGGNLDLVGLQGQDMADPGSPGTGSTGGALTAGNGTFIGTLQVQGGAQFANGLSLTGSLSANGQVNFHDSTNSTSAFTVQNAAGSNLFTVDTTNNKITIGGAASSTPTLLVLGQGNSGTDPTGTDGAMYYNTSLGKFRCYENGVWKNCTSAGSGDVLQGGNSFGATMVLGTLDNNQLNLITNSQTRLTVSSTGYVGIGNTSPANLLSVGTLAMPFTGAQVAIGTVSSGSTALFIQGVSGQSAELIDVRNNTNGVVAQLLNNGTFILQGSASTLRTFDQTSASTNSNNLTIRSGNATGATSNSGGVIIDVGTATGTAGTITIGTANQSGITLGRVASANTINGSSTTINGSTSGSGTALTVNNSSSTGKILDLQDNGGTVVQVTDGGVLQVNSTGTAGAVEKFRVNTPGAASATAAAIIATGGNSNIGLVIQGNSATQSADLQQWQSYNGTSATVVAAVGASGGLGVGQGISSAFYSADGLLQVRSTSGAATVRIGDNGIISAQSSQFQFQSMSGRPTTFTNSAVGDTVLRVKGFAGQIEDLQQWQNSDGLTRASVNYNSVSDFMAFRAMQFQGAGSGDPYIQMSSLGMQAFSNSTTRVSFAARAIPLQTANLQEWQNSGGTALSSIDVNGNLHFGLAPASTGVIRLENGTAIYARNAANNGNIQLIGADGSDNVSIASGGQQTSVGGNLVVTGSLTTGAPIAVTSGGTGAGSFVQYGLLFGAGTGALQSVAAGNSGQCLNAVTGNAPTWASCTPAASGNVNQGGNNFGTDMTLGTLDNYGFNVLTNNVATFKLSNTGAATFQNASNSPTAFQIQNQGGTSLFSVDSTNSRIYIGNATPDSIGTLLVLDTKNTSADPTGVDGAMYYNSHLAKFRCFEGSIWKDCIYNMKSAAKASDQTFSTTSYASVNDLSFNILANRSYSLQCSLLISAPSGSLGGSISMTGPSDILDTQYTASFTKSFISGDTYSASSAFDDTTAGTHVYTTSTGANRFIVNYNAVIVNGPVSGTWQLRARAFDGASQITTYANSSCEMKPL